MQAIILAAGMGKRLGDLTKDNTKCMVKVNGVTLIERLLNQLEHLNLTQIVLVVGYKSVLLRTYIQNLKIKTSIVFVENDVYDKTNNIYSLYLAKQYLINDDTLLFESDLIVEDSIIEKLLDHPYPDLALVAKFESWMDGTVMTIDDNNKIVRFIPTNAFKFEEIPTYYKTVNIYKFSKQFSSSLYVPFLEAYCSALGNNEYYEQVLRVITLLDKPTIKALPLTNEHWYEIDDIQDLNIAESIFANPDEALNKITSRYGGYWRYPQIIDFCYLVNPFFPNSRLIAEIKANFDRLLCEYPSGQGVNDLLVAKDFDLNISQVVVGNGAAELIKSLMEHISGKVGVIRPTFEEYPNRLSSERLVEFQVINNDFKYDEQDIINFFSNYHIENLVLINPDNPSGNFITANGLLKLIEWTEKKNIQFIVDESFLDFSTQAELTTLLNADFLKKYPHIVVVKSISKSYGVPGLRLGFLASGNQTLIQWMRKNIAIWNINSFAEFYLQIFGKYRNDYKIACQCFIEEREYFMQQLSSINHIRVIPSQANYFMCELLGKYSSRALTRILLTQYNILIKDCSSKVYGKNLIRIAVRNREDNQQLITALKNILQ